jgi:hypothetical protein
MIHALALGIVQETAANVSARLIQRTSKVSWFLVNVSFDCEIVCPTPFLVCESLIFDHHTEHPSLDHLNLLSSPGNSRRIKSKGTAIVLQSEGSAVGMTMHTYVLGQKTRTIQLLRPHFPR